MERIFASSLCDVLVAGNATCFQSLRGELLSFERDQMGTEWELINRGLLPTEIENPDLGIRYTTAVPGLRVWLVLAVAVAVIV